MTDTELKAIEFTPEQIAKVKAAVQVARDDMKEWNLRARVDWKTMHRPVDRFVNGKRV